MALLKFANQSGIPCIEAVSVSSEADTLTINFNPHSYRAINMFYGGFWVKIPQAVTAESGSEKSLQFSTIGVAGSTVPVYLANGSQATDGAITSTGNGIYLAFYDRDNNRVQLI